MENKNQVLETFMELQESYQQGRDSVIKLKTYTPEQIVHAFAKWAIDYTENPEKFESEPNINDPEWVKDVSDYFMGLMDELSSVSQYKNGYVTFSVSGKQLLEIYQKEQERRDAK